MSKRGLGKGLDALIPETEKSAKKNSISEEHTSELQTPKSI